MSRGVMSCHVLSCCIVSDERMNLFEPGGAGGGRCAHRVRLHLLAETILLSQLFTLV